MLTNCHKLSGNIRLAPHSSAGRKSDMPAPAGPRSLRRLRGESFQPLELQTVLDLWPHHSDLCPRFHVAFFPLCHLPVSSPLRTLVIRFRGDSNDLGCSHHENLHFIASARAFLSKSTFTGPARAYLLRGYRLNRLYRPRMFYSLLFPDLPFPIMLITF